VKNLPHNTHILRLQTDPDEVRTFLKSKWRYRALAALPALFKLNNRFNSVFRLSFSYDHLNDYFGVKKSYRFKESMLQGYMTSLEQATNIYHLLCQTLLLCVPGDVVELGCNEGTTAILLRKTLDDFESDRTLHVYDSFEGLPEHRAIDGSFGEGALATTEQRLIANFKHHGAAVPQIHRGWFRDTLPTQLPDQISFAHLDGDLYDSITDSLVFVYPRLSRGAVVVVDDYCDPSVLDLNNIAPGVKSACDDFLRDKPEKMTVLIAGHEAHGYFRKW
jgi:O-methyltransferase